MNRRLRLALVMVAVSLPATDMCFRAIVGTYQPQLDVIFFDIDHGDAALTRLPSGTTLLIDAGNRTSTWDYGERVIVPHLVAERIDRIDAVVISHPHGDHYGGLAAIIDKVPIGCVYDNGHELENDLFNEYLDLVSLKVGCRRTLTAGTRITIDPATRLTVLSPPPGYESEGENDESVVLKLDFGATSILFTGDIERDAEDFLVARYCETLDSDVVKVPHHGSRTSSTQGLVHCASPTWAVISVGRKETYGLPNSEVLERWKKEGSTVVVTHRSGAVRFRSNGRSIWRIQ